MIVSPLLDDVASSSTMRKLFCSAPSAGTFVRFSKRDRLTCALEKTNLSEIASQYLNVSCRKPFHSRAPRTTGSNPDRKSTRLNSSHANISYAVFCLKKKTNNNNVNVNLVSKPSL